MDSRLGTSGARIRRLDPQPSGGGGADARDHSLPRGEDPVVCGTGRPSCGHPLSTLYVWEGRLDGDPASLAAAQDDRDERRGRRRCRRRSSTCAAASPGATRSSGTPCARPAIRYSWPAPGAWCRNCWRTTRSSRSASARTPMHSSGVDQYIAESGDFLMLRA